MGSLKWIDRSENALESKEAARLAENDLPWDDEPEDYDCNNCDLGCYQCDGFGDENGSDCKKGGNDGVWEALAEALSTLEGRQRFAIYILRHADDLKGSNREDLMIGWATMELEAEGKCSAEVE